MERLIRHAAMTVTMVLALSTPCLSRAESRFVAQLSNDSASKQGSTMKALTLPNAKSGQAQAVVAYDDGFYLAGTAWNDVDGVTLWLWRLDSSGEIIWTRRLAQQQNNEELRIVSLLKGSGTISSDQPIHGIRVVYRQGLESHLVFFKSSGDQTFRSAIGMLEDSHGLASDGKEGMYLYGTSMTALDKPSTPWIASVSRLGAVLWKQTILVGPDADTDDDQPGEREASAEADSGQVVGIRQMSLLFDGVIQPDGSVTLVGQTGTYNKFGQGPSKLWLLRIDSTGKKLAETFVENGRVFPAGQDLISRCRDGLIVPYTTEELPPIGGAPGNAPLFGFQVRAARFDLQLQKLWDEPLARTMMPGAATISGPEPFVALSTFGEQLQMHSINREGDEVWDIREKSPRSFLLPLATLRFDNGVVAVFNSRKNDVDQTKDLQQVLFVFAQPPQP